MEHLIAEEDWRSWPGLERVWYFWLRQFYRVLKGPSWPASAQ
jgi:hypothetical protein